MIPPKHYLDKLRNPEPEKIPYVRIPKEPLEALRTDSFATLHCTYTNLSTTKRQKILLYGSLFIVGLPDYSKYPVLSSEGISLKSNPNSKLKIIYPLKTIRFTLLFKGLDKSVKWIQIHEDHPYGAGLKLKDPVARNEVDVYHVRIFTHRERGYHFMEPCDH